MAAQATLESVPSLRSSPSASSELSSSAPSDVPVTSQVDIEDSSSPSSPHSVSSTIRRNLQSTDTGICSEHPIGGVLPAERHGRQSTTEIELAGASVRGGALRYTSSDFELEWVNHTRRGGICKLATSAAHVKSARDLAEASIRFADLAPLFAPGELKATGFVAENFKRQGVAVDEPLTRAFTFEELREGGYDAAQLRARFALADLARAGACTIFELKAALFEAPALCAELPYGWGVATSPRGDPYYYHPALLCVQVRVRVRVS